MFQSIVREGYRKDIDGLRTLAVLAVFVFHCGFLPNGYLGVDVFFVISGYLITKILFLKSQAGRLSLIDFYKRRIRRILPLVSFFCLIVLPLGAYFMLPDDFENLAQSVIATNFFSNNILQYITTGNYWDVVNEYKPLMHTWSLAIEEQYYFVYPFLFLILRGKLLRFLPAALVVLTILSLGVYVSDISEAARFYLLPARFYELSIGGLAAVLLTNRLITTGLRWVLIVLLILLLGIDVPAQFDGWLNPLSVLVTVALLITTSKNEGSLTTRFLQNPVMSFLGRISFSIYMWHQVLLAFGRYAFFEEVTPLLALLLLVLTTLLSWASYELIEQPFRNRKKYSIQTVLMVLGLAIGGSTAASFYVYRHAGVLRDYPMLDIYADQTERNIHGKYNDRIYEYDRPFADNGRTKVLLIGNSFARDWGNVLFESSAGERIDLSFVFEPKSFTQEEAQRLQQADLIFWADNKFLTPENAQRIGVPQELFSRLWFIGTKRFGQNSGLFYNHRGDDVCTQRAKLPRDVIDMNDSMRKAWSDRYIDLLSVLATDDQTVGVFTDDCKLISQDTRHLTKAGAVHLAKQFDRTIQSLISQPN